MASIFGCPEEFEKHLAENVGSFNPTNFLANLEKMLNWALVNAPQLVAEIKAIIALFGSNAPPSPAPVDPTPTN